MNHDEQDDLWELLGKARTPQPSPFLARNVLREVRGREQERGLGWMQLFRRWQTVLAALAVGLLGVGGWAWEQGHRHHQQEEQRQLLAMAERVYASPDYPVINDLDDLLEAEKNSAWLSAEVN